MANFLIYFVVVSNVLLYLSLNLFDLGKLSVSIPIFISIIISIKIVQKTKDKIKIRPLFLLGLPLLFSNLLIQYPLIRKIVIEGFSFISYSSATDFFKHMYTITSIKSFGLPPQHPYMPLSGFKYYYFYYLLPSGLTYFFPNYQHYILYFYVGLSSFLSVVIISFLVSKIVKNKMARVVAIAYIFYGQGLDIIPTLLNKEPVNHRLIEQWSINAQMGLRIDNPFTSFIWTPQHFFATTIGLLFLYILYNNNKVNLIVSSIFLCFIVGSSTFVAITICALTGLVFLFHPTKRKAILKLVGLSFLLLIPFLLYVQSSGTIFSVYEYKPYNFFSRLKHLNFVVSFIVEYGILYFINIAYLLFSKTNKKITKMVLLGLILAPIVTLFIRSQNYNDFALRATLPMQMISAIVFALIVSQNKKINFILIPLFILNITISSLGYLYEIRVRWQDRQILDIETSQLITKLRTFNPNKTISALGKGEWVYKIPPLAFRPIYSADLYDSANYFHHQSQPYANFFTTNISLFHPNKTQSSKQLIDQFQQEINNIKLAIGSLDTDYTLINKKIFVKKDINPYFELLINKLDTSHIKLTDNFYLLDNNSALAKLNDYSILVDPNGQEINIKNNKLTLDKGLYIISACNYTRKKSCLRFEPDDHYALFEDCLEIGECVGNIFFQPNKTKTNINISPSKCPLTVYVNQIVTKQHN